jgi:hypothetical protein
MDGIYFHPAGHKHHFRNVLPKNGKADLHDDDGKLVFKDVPVSTEEKPGHVIVPGAPPEKSK